MGKTQAEVIAILASGDFDALVGEFESDWLECKSQPYGLNSDEQKLELAKDVSGLANASGGIILIGFATKVNPVHGDDQIDKVRVMSHELINPDQYRQSISSWLYPPLEDVEVTVFPSSQDDSKSVAAIIVPSANDLFRPIMVRRTLLGSQRRVELFFGYFERKQTRVVHYSVERLHTLLRDGRSLSSDLKAGFDVLQTIIECRFPERATLAETPNDIDERIEAALDKVCYNPSFFLAAIPSRALDLRGLFQSRGHDLVRLLDNPPEIRQSGFDINAGGNSRVQGKLRRAYIENTNLLEIHKDGLVVFVAQADGECLCWGSKHQQHNQRLINQLALVEMVYLFCVFSVQVFSGELQDGDTVTLRLSIRQKQPLQQEFVLKPGPLFGRHSGSNITLPSLDIPVRVFYGSESPERWAGKLLADLYAAFGYEEDCIPYADISEEGPCIDRGKIENHRL
jgi:hypothetical protein